jgi:TBC1 domain family member 8/9
MYPLLTILGIAKWSISDIQSPSHDPAKQEHGYFSGSTRNRNISLSPWGGGPVPADDDFMRRLFRKWDTEIEKSLTLQNVVVGMAHVKGSRDIMTNIAYFFELFDDDSDGKIDRDGILKMSEALLFLGRRGLESAPITSPSTTSLGTSGDQTPIASKDEQFLSAVSSFIRRCFEYADPDHVADLEETNGAVEDFSIGDDDDLMDLGPVSPKSPTSPRSLPKMNLPPMPSEDKPHTHAANIALDPAHPLFITLPTFRMLILADEVLEHFFDTAFPNSFHLADAPASTSSSSNLTTFTNLGRVMPSSSSGPVPGSGGVVPPGKGLRGMLDNIVSDGMRVATEVRRRMEDAGRELDRASGTAQDQDEEDEEHEESGRAYGGDAERRSVRDGDRDLLEGAEIGEIGDSSGKVGDLLDVDTPTPTTPSKAPAGEAHPRHRAVSESTGKRESVIEFER